MAYRLLREFRQASTHLDTPPFSLSHHPFSGIALLRSEVEKSWSDAALQRGGEVRWPEPSSARSTARMPDSRDFR